MADETTCGMVVSYKADANLEQGEEILCGKPIWLPSNAGGGYCRECAKATAAEGLDMFTKADAETFVALLGAECLTPLPGGHVFAGTWEGLAARSEATCAACGEPVKRNGEMVPPKERDGAGVERDVLCEGWGRRSPPGALARVVTAVTREAPDDQPNGPTEAAIEALHAAHLSMLDIVLPLVSANAEALAALRVAGERVSDLTAALADDSRALRLAAQADERATPGDHASGALDDRHGDIICKVNLLAHGDAVKVDRGKVAGEICEAVNMLAREIERRAAQDARRMGEAP